MQASLKSSPRKININFFPDVIIVELILLQRVVDMLNITAGICTNLILCCCF